MARFNCLDLPLHGLKRLERHLLRDDRGFLTRIFCAEELKSAGWNKPIVQINHTHTKGKGTLRGMHFQHPPAAEIKLVSCILGSVFDVAVDLRRDSPTFLHWHGEILSADNARALLIPDGFAHGFQSLDNEVELLYCHSAPYMPHLEDGLHPQDKRLAIDWPLSVGFMSDKDKARALLTKSFNGIIL